MRGTLRNRRGELPAEDPIAAVLRRVLPANVDGDLFDAIANVEVSETTSYKVMMLSGVPNLASAFGYTNASWTLKSDTCACVCRLLHHVDEHGYRQCTPRNPDPSIALQPFVESSSGYVLRSIDQFQNRDRRPRGGCTRTTRSTS